MYSAFTTKNRTYSRLLTEEFIKKPTLLYPWPRTSTKQLNIRQPNQREWSLPLSFLETPVIPTFGINHTAHISIGKDHSWALLPCSAQECATCACYVAVHKSEAALVCNAWSRLCGYVSDPIGHWVYHAVLKLWEEFSF